MKWSDRDFKIDPDNRYSITYAPHGALDYLWMGSPVLSVVPCERAVVVEACEGVFVLRGHPDIQDTWTLTKVLP